MNREAIHNLYLTMFEPEIGQQPDDGSSKKQIGCPTLYTQEKADAVIHCFEIGLRPVTAAQRIGVSRLTLFNWRNAHPDFAQRWEHAVGAATDLIEERLYQAALAGDIQACLHWLRSHRTEVYDKPTLAKLGMLRAALERGQMIIDADGIPRTVQGVQEPVVVLPDNGRGDRVIDVLPDDSSNSDDHVPTSTSE